MEALNLTGNGRKNHTYECFLRPFDESGNRFLDAQVAPSTKIEAGSPFYYRTNDGGSPIIMTVAEVVERRPCRGDWKGEQPLDWVRLRIMAQASI